MIKRKYDSYNLLVNNTTVKFSEFEKRSIEEDNTLSNFIGIYSLLGILNIIIKLIFPMSILTWRTISNIFMIVLIILLVKSMFIVIKRVLFKFIIFELIFMVIYLISILMNNADKALLLNGAFNTLCICIPMMMCVYAINDKGILYKNLLKYSYIIIFLSTLSLIVLGSKVNYSMSLSSYLIVFAMIQWNESLENRRLKNYIIALYSFIFILVFGNRGAVLCLSVFIGLKIIHLNKGSLKKKLFIIFIMFIAIIVCLCFNEILSFINIVLKKHDIRSYTLTQLINKEFFTSNSRIELFFYYIGLIKQKPIFGWGVWGGYISEGLGPHNVILEFILAFGIFFGMIFSLIYIVTIVRVMFFSRRTKYLYDLSLIYCSANITMLLSAGDFLKKPDFFIFIALCLTMPLVRKSNNI